MFENKLIGGDKNPPVKSLIADFLKKQKETNFLKNKRNKESDRSGGRGERSRRALISNTHTFTSTFSRGVSRESARGRNSRAQYKAG